MIKKIVAGLCCCGMAVFSLQAESHPPVLAVLGTGTATSKVHSRINKVTRLNRNSILRSRFLFTTAEGDLLVARRRSRVREQVTDVNRKEAVFTENISGRLYNLSDLTMSHSVGEFYLTTARGAHDYFPAIHAIFSNSVSNRSYTLKTDRTRRKLTLVDTNELLRRSCDGTLGSVDHTAHADGADPVSADGNTVVDILIAYSSQAFSGVGGASNMAAEASNAIASANEGYTHSQIPLELRLVHVVNLEEAESGNLGTDLGHLANSGDAKFESANTLAIEYGADVVTLLVENGDYCGMGYLGYPWNVVARGCLSNYSFQHEVGHNFGSEHDVDNAGGGGAYSYSYGWRFTGTDAVQYRTVMSYAPGSRINYFSNPTVNYQGVATGTSTANNALSITNRAPIMAAYREVASTTPTPIPTSEVGGTTSLLAQLERRNGKSFVTGSVLDADGLPVIGVPIQIYYKSSIARKFSRIASRVTTESGYSYRISKKGKYKTQLTSDPTIQSRAIKLR